MEKGPYQNMLQHWIKEVLCIPKGMSGDELEAQLRLIQRQYTDFTSRTHSPSDGDILLQQLFLEDVCDPHTVLADDKTFGDTLHDRLRQCIVRYTQTVTPDPDGGFLGVSLERWLQCVERLGGPCRSP